MLGNIEKTKKQILLPVLENRFFHLRHALEVNSEVSLQVSNINDFSRATCFFAWGALRGGPVLKIFFSKTLW